jgi:hypothetical protein
MVNRPKAVEILRRLRQQGFGSHSPAVALSLHRRLGIISPRAGLIYFNEPVNGYKIGNHGLVKTGLLQSL